MVFSPDVSSNNDFSSDRIELTVETKLIVETLLTKYRMITEPLERFTAGNWDVMLQLKIPRLVCFCFCLVCCEGWREERKEGGGEGGRD